MPRPQLYAVPSAVTRDNVDLDRGTFDIPDAVGREGGRLGVIDAKVGYAVYGSDPPRARTENLLIKRYLNLSAVLTS